MLPLEVDTVPSVTERTKLLVENDISIFYELHRNFGEGCSVSYESSTLRDVPKLNLHRGCHAHHRCSSAPSCSYKPGDPVQRVIMIMGLAADGGAWAPQVHGLLQDDTIPIELCIFDNRGIGRSTSPTDKTRYTTERMAMDTLRLMDHLKWESAHVVGHSMGGFVALKMAVASPKRVLSCTVINSSAGGLSTIPWKGWKIMFKGRNAKTPEERTVLDLKCHYTDAYLEGQFEGRPRKHLLTERYVAMKKSAKHPQPPHGFQGQMNACMYYRFKKHEAVKLRASGVPVHVIHGDQDIVARWRSALQLARMIKASFLLLPAGHFAPIEKAEEINAYLLQILRQDHSMRTEGQLGDKSKSDLTVVGGSEVSVTVT